ncbi:MAG: restriction endonuclease subunit S [Anaerolineaceae bacterium]|nr:restriction endonuclease subunit S [Anaerolineaceae bacterium]
MPDGWEWTSVSEITLPIEKVIPQERFAKQFTYLDISSIDNKVHKIIDPKVYLNVDAPSRARQLVQANDILFSTVRTYLENVALVPEIFDGQIASTGFAVLRANNAILPKLIFYYCLTKTFLEPLNELQRGTSYPAVRDSDVRAQPFPLPPLLEQERIVAKIEELFTQLEAGTTALRCVQAELKRYKASVLKSACEGRLVPQDPSDEPAEEVLRRLGKVPREGDELPTLPERWCWTKVGDLSRKIQYGTSEKANLDSSGIPVLRMGNIQDGQLDFSNMKYLPIYTKGLNDLILDDGDLIFNRTNSAELVGKTAVYKNHHIKATFASYLIRVKFQGHCIPDYISFYINSLLGRKFIASVVSQQVGQANVNGTKLANMTIPLPPLAEQLRIVAEVERRLSVIQELEGVVSANLKRAERLRQSILKRAFEGKLLEQNTEDKMGKELLEMKNTAGEAADTSGFKQENLF